MSWKDRYLPASFRGARFHVEDASNDYGRRTVVHEFAQKDTPKTEDTGRKTREFSIGGYILGTDYDKDRDLLQEACETAGAGLLIHPYKGEIRVVCQGLSISESSTEGGICKVSMRFIEAGDDAFPQSTVDNTSAVIAAKNKLRDEAEKSFLSDFHIPGLPGFVGDSAVSQLEGFSTTVQESLGTVNDMTEAGTDLYYEVRSLADDAVDLINTPTVLARRVFGVVDLMRGGLGNGGFNQMLDISDTLGQFTGKTTTPSRQQQSSNYNAMHTMMRTALIGEAAHAAALAADKNPATVIATGDYYGAQPKAGGVAVFESYQEIIAARDMLTERLDTEAESTSSDGVYSAIGAMRAEVVKALPPSGVVRPRLMSYTPRTTLPSIVIAHRLYADAGRADEIVSRNKPRHPGFMMGGVALEVLANE